MSRTSLPPLAVLGGGVSGISAALALARTGQFRVTLFEKSDDLGGLCAPVGLGDGTPVDRYYHVILPRDRAARVFVESLNPKNGIVFRPARSGFFGRGRLVPFASAGDFLRFPFLSPAAKVRLALGILRTVRTGGGPGIETLTVPAWLKRRFGARVAERFWDPLLRSKLGDARDRTPASFMAATIRRLYGARSGTGRREEMGFVRGGYAPIIRRAEKDLAGAGVEIRKGTPAISILPDRSGLSLATSGGTSSFDRVLSTLPLPDILAIVGGGASGGYWDRLRSVEYLGVVCVLAVLRRPLSPYYVINLLDTGLPFTGVVESTNVLGPESAGGRHLVYLPRYVSSADPLFDRPEAGIESEFLGGLFRMFPDLRPGEVLETRTHKNRMVQPIPVFGPPVRSLGFRTPLPGLHLAGSAFVGDSTVNNDAVLRVASDAVEELLDGAAAALTGDRRATPPRSP